MTTWVDVASDATKIGLGALVGGCIAMLADRIKRRSESEEKRNEYQRRMMESIATDFGEFYRVVNTGIYDLRSYFNEQDPEKKPALRARIDGNWDKMVEGSHLLSSCQHRLLLLNDLRSKESLNVFHERYNELYRESTAGNVEELYEAVRKARDDFFEHLSARFRN